MTKDVESEISKDADLNSHTPKETPAPNGWLKMGSVAAASALLGGLAAAWFYRKTLSRLREAENEIPDELSGTTEDGKADDF